MIKAICWTHKILKFDLIKIPNNLEIDINDWITLEKDLVAIAVWYDYWIFKTKKIMVKTYHYIYIQI